MWNVIISFVGIFIVLFVCTNGQYPEKLPVVRTANGFVQGAFASSYGNRTYMKFTGIKYAKAPIEHRRFEPPVPTGTWLGIFPANHTTKCIQLIHNSAAPEGILDGEEDCLDINIFIPRDSTSNLRNARMDVLVHIHGGSFSFSNGAAFHPTFIMDRDLVYVTFNYRLGIFGFLSTENSRFPGNMALRDQILALKWIKTNIRSFGGNPNNVFITGMSAGAGSVEYITVSPLARGLFHRAHSMSGSALRMMQAKPLEKVKRVGKQLGCPVDQINDLMTCLKERPAKMITEAQRMFRPWLYNPIAPFSAIVDKWSASPVLPMHPIRLMQQKRVADVPFINSFCTHEGLYPAAEFLYKDSYLKELNDNWDELAQSVLNLKDLVPDNKLLNLTSTIRKHYFGDKNISLETFDIVIKMVGDRLYNCDINMGVRLHSAAIKSPVYSYLYDYYSDFPDVANALSGKQEKYGVVHGADLTLVLPQGNYPAGTYTKRDEKMKDFLLDIWVDFAKNGRLDWVPMAKDTRVDIVGKHITEDYSMETRSVQSLGECEFWESLKIRQTN